MPFYTPEPTRQEIIDTGLHMFVPVIASYNTQGKCRPLYFEYRHPDGVAETCHVDKVISCDHTGIFGSSYRCAVTVCGCRKYVELYYHSDSGRWTIHKWMPERAK